MDQDSDNNQTGELAYEPEPVSGILEMIPKMGGRLLRPSAGGKRQFNDVSVTRQLIQRFKLKEGSTITGTARPAKGVYGPQLTFIDLVDGLSPIERKKIFSFEDLTSINPEERFKLETKDGHMTNRVLDLLVPIGKGQRTLIVAPPRTGKTTLLHRIIAGLEENHPDCHLMILLVDERPEEVTDFKQCTHAEIFASSNDEAGANHIRVAELVLARARNLVETGKDVIVLLDSLTRLSRVYNVQNKGVGRTLSGGLDIQALEKPRQLFSTARNTEEAGSLTIIATALVETGSRMDDLIFQEFKGTGNAEIVLERKTADMRIFPALDIGSSGTRREEKLVHAEDLRKIHFLRRALLPMSPHEAMETLLQRMNRTETNQEFLALLKC